MKTQFIDLAAYANAHAATYDADRAAGYVNAWRNSFPAEDLPFGATLLIGGFAFTLPHKRAGAPDHVEALGQEIDVGAVINTRTVGILGFGELGDQPLGVTLTSRFGHIRRATAILPNWLLPRGAAPDAREWRATHLHYPDYELDSLRPALFGIQVRLSADIQPLTLTLEANPLAHVMAVSLLIEERDYA
jgi:hypothetical protein